MSDRAYANAQLQQQTLSGSSPKNSLVQRTCACGQHTIAGGECEECREKREGTLHCAQRVSEPRSAPGAVPGSSPAQEHGPSFKSAFDRASHFGHDFSRIPIHPHARAIQTKLAINKPGDEYEQEADQVSDQVMATSAGPAVSGAPPHIQRFSGQSDGQMEAAPASVDQALASPGKPLEPTLRQDMEQRFGHDFSRVQLHSGAAAEQSAQEVNANAYTVGHDIVFGTGQFAPWTHQGRRLIAHELTHVVQQNQGAQQVQRWANCKPARLSLKDCPPREPGEVQRAHAWPMVFPLNVSYPISGEEAVLIANFDIGNAAIKPNLHHDLNWTEFLKKIALNRSQWKLLGFTDCQGGENLNKKLREDRAAAVFNILPQGVKSQIVSHEAAPTYDCITENDTAADRTLNRSVALILVSTVADFAAEEITASFPRKEPDTEGCSDEQRRRLAVAFPAAELMIKNAIVVISGMEKGSEEEVFFMKYFGKDAFSHRWHIKRGYVDTLRAWQGSPTYKCVKQGTDPCGPSDYGYTGFKGLVTRSPIIICENSFKGNDLELADTVLHEESHALDWTRDIEECGGTGCSLETEDAEANAASYSRFASEAFVRWH